MSIRANSLRNLCFDGVYFALAMSLVAFAATALAQDPQPRIERVGEDASDRRLSDNHIDSRLNTDDNMPSGDPSESAEGKREAMILGMKLFERSSGDIRVVDVAATSPAWDAGVRKGDRIKALDGIKPKALAAWIDDVGKVLKDTEDGHAVAAEVERDGEPLALRIKVPVSNAAEVRDARQEEQAIAKVRAGQQGQVPQGQPGGVPLGYGDDRTDNFGRGYGPGYGGYGGAFGGFFGDDSIASDTNSDDRMANSAVAPLMAVNTLGGNAGGNQGQTGGQVGMAGFQYNGQSVDAMVVVRGLPQGSYQVGIGTGDGVGAGTGTGFDGLNAAGENQFGLNPALEGTDFSGGADRNQNGFQNNNQNGGADNRNLVNPSGAPRGQFNPSGAARPEQQQPGFAPQGGQAPVVPQGNFPGGAPAPGGAAPAGGGGAAAGAGDGASLANPASAVLAQQLDPGQAVQGAGAQQQPIQQGVQNPVNPGAAGTRQNNGTGQQTRSGNPYDPRENSERQRQAEQNANPLSDPTGTPFVASIGVLQIGPDGTGTVQGQLEGVAVRNLAGMNVIVQSTNWQGQGGAAADPRVTQGAQPNGRQQPGQIRPGQRLPQQAGQQLGPQGQPTMRGAQGIVAMGQIQLRNSGNTATGVDSQTGLQNGQQPVNDGAAQQQRQTSNPGEDFNPSR